MVGVAKTKTVAAKDVMAEIKEEIVVEDLETEWTVADKEVGKVAKDVKGVAAEMEEAGKVVDVKAEVKIRWEI
jgi:hypothetical protein